MKIKCKACQNGFFKLDTRGLCSHCAFRIDTADAEASDINGIREDMWQMGIPTQGFSRNPQGTWLEDEVELEVEDDESN